VSFSLQVHNLKRISGHTCFLNLYSENRLSLENLNNELVNTGKFTEQDAPVHVKKAQQNGLIFERRVDMYALA
jgi:hypothetical protein